MNVIARKFSYTFLDKRLLYIERPLRGALDRSSPSINDLGGLKLAG